LNLLDIRTILIGFVASDLICTLVITSLWLQHRRQSPELWLWTADFALQTVAILLIAVRGFVPDVLSMVGGNMLGIAGTMLLFIGLERYLGRRGPQVHNWVMLAVFTAIHTYFATVRPILAVRNINLSVALLFICVQCAWLLLRRVEPRLRQATKFAGTVFSVYAAVSAVRIVESVVATTGNDYLRSGLFDALVLLSYQMLFIALTLSLFLMVNRRLSGALQEDIARRERTEEDLRRSEEKFALAFQGNPDAITLTSIEDGTIFDVNESFSRIVGYSRDEAIGRTTVDLNLWGNPADRTAFVELLRSQGHPRNLEMTFRKKSGELLTGQISGEVLRLEQGACVLSMIRDITDRRRAEDKLSASETRYRRLFEAAKDGILILDADTGVIVDVNPFLAELLGFSHKEFLGKHIWDLGFFKDVVADQDRFLELQRMQYIRYDNLPLETADGQHINVEFVSSVYHVGDGNVVQCNIRDITLRRKLEQDVAHLASFPAQNPYPVLEVKTDGAVRFANAAVVAALSQLGLDPDVRQFLPGTPEELVLLRSHCEQAPQTRELRLGGHTFLRVVTASPGESSLRVYAIDITERTKIVEELAISNAALAEAQAIAHIGDWSMDTATRTFVWSDEMYVIHGIEPGSPILHEAYLELIHPGDRKHVFEVMGSAMAGKQQEFVVDYRIVRPDGTERFVALTGKTVLEGSGAVGGIRGTTQDITDRKQAEAEREAMQAQLVQSKKVEAVGQLAGGVAHNFNNLLTGILGYIDIARMDIAPTNPAASSLETARTAAVKAAGIARQLLSFGRNAVLLPTVQNANAALESALDLVCSSLPGSIEVVRSLSPDSWDVLVDSSQLTQVLLELANNAREAMEDKGTITVCIGNVTLDDTYVATVPFARTGEFVAISVADTGPGIDPAMLGRLFEPFATTKLFGRGLGLATVFGALKQAGGWVDAHSEPGAGTKIDLYLPRHVEGQSPEA
jgi:two-component system cell cycle sensor histidine kinase/response regulator CckA